MFGWEFAPVQSGGLGTACAGITGGLLKAGVAVRFVLPRLHVRHQGNGIEMTGLFDQYAAHYQQLLEITSLYTDLHPYLTEETYVDQQRWLEDSASMEQSRSNFIPLYSKDLFNEVFRYTQLAAGLAAHVDYDIIHCHDWMTYDAGIWAKKISGRPLIAQVHATEFDRTGGHPNQWIYDAERRGMEAADLVITVSGFTKRIVQDHYGIAADKIRVVHNAIEHHVPEHLQKLPRKNITDQIVLFLGRITIQKGPDYFLEAASEVLKLHPHTKFVIAGSGDMEKKLIDQAAEMGLAKHVFFTGFLSGDDVSRAFRLADVYVMPSVSEPFGLTALESIVNGTPVIISKQSGVSEVIHHCLKVDFWDIDQLVNKIVSVLRHPNSLAATMIEHGQVEVDRLTWDRVGMLLKGIYQQLVP